MVRLTALLTGIGGAVVVRWGYFENHPPTFFGGLAAMLLLAALELRLESPRTAAVGRQVWQRFAAALTMFGVIEAGYRVAEILPAWNVVAAARSADAPLKVVTFAEAQGDPYAFAQWWKAYSSEWNRDSYLIQTPTPGGPVPYEFKPNSERTFLHGRVKVNSLSLCDREIPRDKGDKYRIVVMGSSHTQCPPIEAGDTPWPAKLERMIHERFSTNREIEVLNAGAAGYTIENNLHRLRTVVLPLKPDMIITYFGYNEFDRFSEEFPMRKSPPKPRVRASRLLGKLDGHFATWLAARRPSPPRLETLEPYHSRLTECRLARVYREYLEIAQREGIQLVVCNFNMAVDEQSPEAAIRFYEQGFPNVRFMIEANRLNTAMLPLVVRPETGARLIDVQAELNGRWDDAFIDLVHLSEAGKETLAENVFRGIVDLLPRAASPSGPAEPSRLVDRPDADKTRL
jgi:lysophospholipase L1-like esterase